MVKALGFISHKEVVVFPWNKKPDVEVVDPSGEFLTFYLDVTLPALHQEAITSREEVFNNARNFKSQSELISSQRCPRSSPHRELLSTFDSLEYGGLVKGLHEFIKICKKKNLKATPKMIE